eukprot:PhF_6_TR25512/c1_g2_i12/m.35613
MRAQWAQAEKRQHDLQIELHKIREDKRLGLSTLNTVQTQIKAAEESLAQMISSGTVTEADCVRRQDGLDVLRGFERESETSLADLEKKERDVEFELKKCLRLEGPPPLEPKRNTKLTPSITRNAQQQDDVAAQIEQRVRTWESEIERSQQKRADVDANIGLVRKEMEIVKGHLQKVDEVERKRQAQLRDATPNVNPASYESTKSEYDGTRTKLKTLNGALMRTTEKLGELKSKHTTTLLLKTMP